MSKKDIIELQDYLENKGKLDDKSRKLFAKLSLPAMTYNLAVCFLGLIAVGLIVGYFWLILDGKEVPEALWGLGGAAIGGLAGIFAGNK